MPFDRKVIPSEGIDQRSIKKFEKLSASDVLPFPSGYMLLIQGSVGSGKSSLLWSVVNAYQEKNYFDLIIIYNACSDSFATWNKLDNEKTTVEVEGKYDPEEMQSLIDEIDKMQQKRRDENKRPYHILMILDDMVTSAISRKGTTTVFDQLVLNRRHLGVNIIITSQQYNILNPSIRGNNLSHFLLLKGNARDIKLASNEHNAGQITEEEFVRMYNMVKKKDKYGFLCVDYKEGPDKRFKNGFTEVIKVKSKLKEEE